MLVVALTAGCTSSSAHAAPAAPKSLPTCRAPEPATLPHAAGSLTEADTGAFCLAAGQLLDVFLTAPAGTPAGSRWGQIRVADTSVIGYGNNGVLTPPVNVTAGVFVGAHHGSTTLSSQLPNGTTWHVTLVVQ
ncbi:hypothetical protein [Actinocrinis sp.]|uniref:hypothetical protein n=1 Tax=Actinocrinis sp. TaxID=1920516 RepID=UPI002BE7412A|nr:hypothetical protein [Actinocrinis sp.]HXR72446.1 hypothetical protein [Actinocrinis sp.]